jgi:hypothetical protein
MSHASSGRSRDLFDKLGLRAITRQNLEREPSALAAVAETLKLNDAPIGQVCRLLAVDATLWHLEADRRDCKRRGDFGPGLIARVCAVYTNNDERARLKAEINRLTGSALTEQKAYDTACCLGRAAAMPARRRDGGVQPTSPSSFCCTV